ncbi:methyltransferase-like protein 27 [Macrobrachium nipponense]|uniref:methyltransferase-like protein 27 n=1 Tax=Macrobrachium nipponense TaxID=159736 RepID=UPI0030C8AF75
MDDKTAYKANYRCHEPGITPDQVADSYTDMAQNYDEILSPERYRGPEIAADEVAARISEDKRRAVKVIDVAAGTGRVGLLLKDKGFSKIDALEPSKGMMALLKQTGVYTNTYSEFLGVGQNSVPKDTYDVLVIAGGMGEGHIPVKGIDDMIRITKSGGFVIIVMRKEYLDYVEEYKDKLIPYMDEMEKQGKWTKVELKTVHNYSFNKDGLVFTYKVV